MKDYYKEIDAAIKRYEDYKYPSHKIEWITDRICWCWKFRHITEKQKDELADRITNVIESGAAMYY